MPSQKFLNETFVYSSLVHGSHKDTKYGRKTVYVSNNCNILDANCSIVCQATDTSASDHVVLYL